MDVDMIKLQINVQKPGLNALDAIIPILYD
jgi:hypothetical protein